MRSAAGRSARSWTWLGVANINQVQQAALQSRLHIPVIFGLDVIHGYKTIFPVPLGEASRGPCRSPERRVDLGQRGDGGRDQVDVQPDGGRQP